MAIYAAELSWVHELTWRQLWDLSVASGKCRRVSGGCLSSFQEDSEFSAPELEYLEFVAVRCLCKDQGKVNLGLWYGSDCVVWEQLLEITAGTDPPTPPTKSECPRIFCCKISIFVIFRSVASLSFGYENESKELAS